MTLCSVLPLEKKVLKIAYENFKNPNFHRGVQKLANHPYPNAKVAYGVMRISKKIEQATVAAQAEFVTLLRKYAKLDDKGDIAPINGPNTFEIRDEVLDEWKAKAAEYEQTVAQIDWGPLKLDDLDGVKLTPMEMGAVSVLLDLPDEA